MIMFSKKKLIRAYLLLGEYLERDLKADKQETNLADICNMHTFDNIQ